MLTADPEEKRLFAAVCAAPPDDAPRRALAAWYAAQSDEECRVYAEYIELALASQAEHVTKPNLTANYRMNDMLTDARKATWSNGVATIAKTYNFHRGFVAMVRLPASVAVPSLTSLVAQCPLEHLDLVADAHDVWDALLAARETQQLESLVVSSNRLDDADFARFCERATMPRLHWLVLDDNPLTMAAAAALAKNTARFPRLSTVIWPSAIAAQLHDETEGGWAQGSVPVTVDRPASATAFRQQFGDLEWLASGPRSANRWRRD